MACEARVDTPLGTVVPPSQNVRKHVATSRYHSKREWALLTTLVLIFGIKNAAPAAESTPGVFLQSIETPDISIGNKLRLTLCVPENRVSEVPTWQVALGAIRIPRVPCGVAVEGSCVVKNREVAVEPSATATESLGAALKVTYDLAYESDHRIAWMRIFDQRNDAGKIDVALFGADGTQVRFAPPAGALPVASKVVVQKYPAYWWIPLMIVGALVSWLFSLRKTHTLRDSTLCPRRYFHAQIEEFRKARGEDTALTRGLIAEMMTKNFGDAATELKQVLTETDLKKQKERSRELATKLANNGIEDADKKLTQVYTKYDANRRWAARLVDEMKTAGVPSAPDPMDGTDAFEAMINTLKERPPPYSLGRLQMAWWFLIVTGGVALMYVSTGTLFKIPGSVLWLIGISVTTAGIGYAIDAREPPKKLPPVSKSWLKDVLTDTHGGDTLYRWQMLVATLLLGLVFVIELVQNFVMTDFDTTMLGLMGISAGTYLGFKWPERSPTTPAAPTQQ